MRLRSVAVGLGDWLAVTAFVREFKTRWPEELITVDCGRHHSIWDHNPHINWGAENLIGTVNINHKKYEELGNMPTQMCADFGFVPTRTEPEIFLTDRERGFGPMALGGLPHPIVAMDYHAMMQARCWPLAHFQETAKLLMDRGITVVEIGGGDKHRPKLSSTRPLCQGLHVRQTAAILAECDLYAGNDSGSFHLAASVGTPQVVLFGPTHSKSFAYETTIPLDNFWCIHPHNVVDACLKRLETSKA
jgi:ADP-heptose:LPS heptosyltransferase